MEHYGTILLVEDDISLAKWVAEYLTEQGYKTTICQRGDQVIEQESLVTLVTLISAHGPGVSRIFTLRLSSF